MKKFSILFLLLAIFVALTVLVSCGEQGPKGDKGEQGAQGEAGRGILKTEIIDGYLWITYTDKPNEPVNVGKIESEKEETVISDLDFYPLDDGTYAVACGKAKLLSNIVIPSTYNGKAVSTIMEDGFKECTNLKTIEIPNSVTTISNGAFRNCSNLTNIEIPNSVTSIGNSAFSGCSSLTNIVIPNSVTSIDNNAFSGCSSLINIVIPISVTSIGYFAFEDCSKLIIYCEAESKPDGWDNDWNWSKRPVVWGYEK